MKHLARRNSDLSSQWTGLVFVLLLCALLVGITAVSLAKPVEPSLNLSLNNAFPALTFSKPVDIAHAGDERLFVVEQAGRIKVTSLIPGAPASVFLDISDRVTEVDEKGLLGLVFHTRRIDDTLYTNIARFQVTADKNVADEGSEFTILRVVQPYENHNAGDLAFGEDGYLYVSLGDGGSGGDPQDNSQNPEVLLGSMLRLDVDGGGLSPECSEAPVNYTIPADNPYVSDQDEKCNEIWAIGLRNPWRFSFDAQFHDLYIGDVGQNAREEIDFQPAGTGGLNYGWRCYEGNLPYNPAGCNPDTSVYTFPIDDYGQENGRCAVTGGFVYRGSNYPAMTGHYFYGDYCSGEIWSMQTDPPGAFPKTTHQDTNFNISTFGEDAFGELYLADRSGGKIYRLQDNAEAVYLRVQKEAPLSVVSGQPFTYTLTVQNSHPVTLTNVIITDTLPAGATYVSGGSLNGNIVSWPTFDLAPYSEEIVQFVVTAETAVINNEYRATTDGGHEAVGTPVTTLIEPVSHIYLPVVLKPR
jgi:uncharacterized repeat protein (TIGR01451 family)